MTSFRVILVRDRYLFDLDTVYTYILILTSSTLKKTWNFLIFFIFLWVIFAILCPDPDSGSGSTVLIESGSSLDPDPKHCRNIPTFSFNACYFCQEPGDRDLWQRDGAGVQEHGHRHHTRGQGEEGDRQQCQGQLPRSPLESRLHCHIRIVWNILLF